MSYEAPIKIADIVEDMHQRKYLLPAIQREFVWSTDQIERLFDSLMRDYPISSFLFWKVEKEKVKEYKFYEFLNEYHERDKKHNSKADTKGKEEITAVLDGQQRLTSLYIGLKGSFSPKSPRKRWDNDQAYPKKLLYLNLVRRPEDPSLEYEFCFLTEQEAECNNQDYWFPVGEILNLKDAGSVGKYVSKISRNYSEHQGDFATDALFKLYNIIHTKGSISYYQEKDQELDKVLNIFIRINSGGTILSYSDLLLSMATAQWEKKDAREEIIGFVNEINNIDNRFNFNKDFVLKSCLVLSDFNNIAFKADNFNKDNMRTIENNWERITNSIRIAVRLVSSFGYDRERLTASYAIIPIAYFLNQIEAKDSYVSSGKNLEDKAKIKKWLILSLIKGSFSGQPDSILRPIREKIKDSNNSFPLEDIIEHFKGTNKTLVFSEDDIAHLLSYQYGKHATFSVLALLYPNLDLKNNTFHVDHIYPKSLFARSTLKKRGISTDDIARFEECYNLLGNLQLLEGTVNEEKYNKEFELWLNEIHNSPVDKKDYMKRHFIPNDVGLEFGNFLHFFEARNKLIEEKLKGVLMR